MSTLYKHETCPTPYGDVILESYYKNQSYSFFTFYPKDNLQFPLTQQQIGKIMEDVTDSFCNVFDADDHPEYAAKMAIEYIRLRAKLEQL